MSNFLIKNIWFLFRLLIFNCSNHSNSNISYTICS